MFLGRQHPGHWPRQLHCFSWGWVSGQSEVMQNLETKTWERTMMEMNAQSCGDDFLGLLPAAFLYLLSFPSFLICSSFLIVPFLLVSTHFPILSSPCCLCCSHVFVLAVMHWHVLTLAKLGQGTFPAESQDMFQDRLKVFLLRAKRVGCIPQNTLPCLWCHCLAGASQSQQEF